MKKGGHDLPFFVYIFNIFNKRRLYLYLFVYLTDIIILN